MSTAKVDAWMPFYPGDYLADTSRLTLEQHGAYLLLILDYWRNGPPPDDDEILRNILGISVGKWLKLAPTIRGLFRRVDGRLIHKRIDAEKAAATERKSKANAKAAAAAKARWADAPSNASSNAPSMPEAMLEQCPSPSPSSNTKTEGETEGLNLPKNLLPATWADWRAHLANKGKGMTPQQERLALVRLAAHGDPESVVQNAIAQGHRNLEPIGGWPDAKRETVTDQRAKLAAEMQRNSTPTDGTHDEPHDITAESRRIA